MSSRKCRTCDTCGQVFTYYENSQGRTRRFCSRACAYKCTQRSAKLRAAGLGKRPSAETLVKLRESHLGLMTGELNPKWKGGISKLTQGLRSHPEYARWRQAVFERDNFTCQLCGERGGRLQADHHPYSFSQYPEHRLNLDNGRTLCKSCHHHVTYVTKEWRQPGPAA